MPKPLQSTHVHSLPSFPFLSFQSPCCLSQVSPLPEAAAMLKDHPGPVSTKVLSGCGRGWGSHGAESGLLEEADERASQGIPRLSNPDHSDSRALKGHTLSLQGLWSWGGRAGAGVEATEPQFWYLTVSLEDTLGDCRSLVNHQAGSNSSYSCSCCYEIIAKNNVTELSPFFFLGFYKFRVIINFNWFCIWYQTRVPFPCSTNRC